MTQFNVIRFNVTDEERDVILAIAERAKRELFRDPDTPSMIHLLMDITATHANGNRLRLRELLEADAFNFAHDIHGIVRHIDRETGELKDFFVPRFAL